MDVVRDTMTPDWPPKETLLLYASILRKPRAWEDGQLHLAHGIDLIAAQALEYIASQIRDGT